MATKALAVAVRYETALGVQEHEDARGRAVEQFLRAVASGALQPDKPTNIVIPERLHQNASRFINAFPDDTKHMYAVKANPSPEVLDRLYTAGITHFDVASQGEIELIRTRFPEAVLYYMHPVKTEEDLDFAFAKNVKGFVVDCTEELEQLVAHPHFDPAHHSVIVRIVPPTPKKGQGAAMPLDKKFGANKTEAMSLLRAAAAAGIADIGMSFHVGSQQMHPAAYAEAIKLAAGYAKRTGVKLTSLDVGGGFPAFESYPHIQGAVPALEFYVAHIERALQQAGLQDVQLLTEPGRALVADAGMLITRGQMRRNGVHLNDGTYGGLYDAGEGIGFRFPTFCFNKQGQMLTGETLPQTIWGPTCDSVDRLDGKWDVPVAFNSGDFMAFELTGAYSQAMRTGFNHKHDAQTLIIRG